MNLPSFLGFTKDKRIVIIDKVKFFHFIALLLSTFTIIVLSSSISNMLVIIPMSCALYLITCAVFQMQKAMKLVPKGDIEV